MRIKNSKLFAVVALGLSLAGCGYDKIPAAEENAKAKWEVVRSAYEQRDSVIPGLVSAVQGCNGAADVAEVAKARARAAQTRGDAWRLTDADALKQFLRAQIQLTGALDSLTTTVRNCPELQAVQSELVASESRVAASLHDYDAAARDYNVALDTLPSMLWAVTLFRGKMPMAVFAGDEQAPRP